MVTRVHFASVDPQASSPAGAVATTTSATSTSLVLASSATASPVAVTTRLNVLSDLGYPADTYVWSPSTQGVRSYVDPTPFTNSQSDHASNASDEPAWEYVSGSPASNASALTPAAHYLMYAAMSTTETGQLIDVYA